VYDKKVDEFLQFTCQNEKPINVVYYCSCVRCINVFGLTYVFALIRVVIDINILLGKLRRKHQGDQTRMRQEFNPYKGMTPPSTQNLKALGLWVFFLICCSTFSFLLNLKLRLTLEYLTHFKLNGQNKTTNSYILRLDIF